MPDDRTDAELSRDEIVATLRASGANMGVASGREAVEAAVEPLASRGILVVERDRLRVRDRPVLRCYARSLEHLLASPSARTH